MKNKKRDHLTNAIERTRIMKEKYLRDHLANLNKQSKTYECSNEREKVSFMLNQLRKHQNWWSYDDYIRHNLHEDIERVRLGLNIRTNVKSYSDQNIPAAVAEHTTATTSTGKDSNMGNTTKLPSLRINSSRTLKSENNFIQNSDIFNSASTTSLPKLESASASQAAALSSTSALMFGEVTGVHSEQFSSLTRRFIQHKPYAIENEDILRAQERFKNLKEQWDVEKVNKSNEYKGKFQELSRKCDYFSLSRPIAASSKQANRRYDYETKQYKNTNKSEIY